MKANLSKKKGRRATLGETLKRSLGLHAMPTWKQRLFTVLYAIVPRAHFSPAASALLIVVSFLQLLSLLISHEGSQTTPIGWLQLSRIFPAIRSADTLFIYTGSFCVTGLYVLTYAGLIFLAYIFPNGKGAFLAGTMQPVVYWVLLIPTTEMLTSVYRCDQTNHNIALSSLVCWDNIHFIQTAVASLLLVLWMSLLIIVTFVSSCSHTRTQSPFAHFPSNFEWWYAALRLGLLLRRIIPEEESNEAYIVLLCDLPLSLSLLKFILPTFPYYLATVSWIFAGSIIVIVTMTLFHIAVFLVKPVHPDLGLGEILFVVCVVIITFTLSYYMRIQRINRLLSNPSVWTCEDRDLVAHLLVDQLSLDADVSDMAFGGYLASILKVPLVPASTVDEVRQPLKSEEPKEIDKEVKRDERLKRVLMSLFDGDVGEELMSPCMKLQQAQLYLSVLNNAHLTHLKILEAEDLDPGLVLQFAAFCLKRDIITFLMRQDSTRAKRGLSCYFTCLLNVILLLQSPHP